MGQFERAIAVLLDMKNPGQDLADGLRRGQMGFYEKYILPKLTDILCRAKPLMMQRQKIVPLAQGRVLEIGIGSGLNLPFYDKAKVTHVWGLDPSKESLAMAQIQARRVGFDVEFIRRSGEEIPLDDRSADTVLVTYTLCTIPDVARALENVGRVLKPGGELIFCEHGAAPDKAVRRWQNRINPIWKKLAGGCHLNRPIPSLIEQNGFAIKRLETMYIPGWKPACFNYWGTAVHR